VREAALLGHGRHPCFEGPRHPVGPDQHQVGTARRGDAVQRDFEPPGTASITPYGVILGPLQVELLDRRRWRARIELANAIFEYLKIFHNRKRRHTALGMRSPIEYEGIHHDNNLSAAPLIQVS